MKRNRSRTDRIRLHRLAKNLYLATDFGQLDVLGELPDVCSYEDLAARSVQVDFGELRCRLIDINTLIAAKRQAGRPHDLRTIAFLEEIKRRQSGPQG